MNYDNYLFRPSMLGDLMTNPPGKKTTTCVEELSETAKGKLLDIWIANTYGRSKEITNKFIEKGLMQEEESMTLYSLVKGELFLKNKDKVSNDYFTGTPDIIHPNAIIDLKTSWDIHTFFNVLLKPMNKTYLCQLNAYMELTGLSKAYLVYTLVNTPEHLIEDEKRKARWRLNVIDEDNDGNYIQAVNDIEKNSIFDDIPREKRYIEFEVNRDEVLIQAMKSRVPMWREFLNRFEYADSKHTNI